LLGKDRAKNKVLFIFIFFTKAKNKVSSKWKIGPRKIGLDKIK
jgi:hypothetical protein